MSLRDKAQKKIASIYKLVFCPHCATEVQGCYIFVILSEVSVIEEWRFLRSYEKPFKITMLINEINSNESASRTNNFNK